MKKHYVKPSTEVYEIETEGMIAASGHDTVIPPEEAVALLTPSCTNEYKGTISSGEYDGGNAAGQLAQGAKGLYTVNINPGCKFNWAKYGFKDGESVRVSHEQRNGKWVFVISKF